MTTSTFREAYGVLQRHAETLRNQREPNIDDLLNIVTESVDAYKVCKARIDAVEKALEQALGGTGVEAAASPFISAQPEVAASRFLQTTEPPLSSNTSSTTPGEPAAPDFDPADDDLPF